MWLRGCGQADLHLYIQVCDRATGPGEDLRGNSQEDPLMGSDII